jgi:3-methylcrotonyl-CoA carboxylase alpha subunit
MPVKKHKEVLFPKEAEPSVNILMASALHTLLDSEKESRSPWSSSTGYRLGSSNQRQLFPFQTLTEQPTVYNVSIRRTSGDRFDVAVTSGHSTTVHSVVRASLLSTTTLRLETNSGISTYSVVPDKSALQSSTSQSSVDRIHVFHNGQRTTLQTPAPIWLKEFEKENTSASSGGIKAPMPSLVVDVRVSVGSLAEKGQVVVVLESMKTEMKLRANFSGIVKTVNCKRGDMVAEGQELVLITEE